MQRKRTSKRRKTTHKRRRVSGVSKGSQDILMTVAGAITGAVANRFVTNALAAQTAIKIDPKLLSAVQAAGGAFIAWKFPAPFLRGVGIGVASDAGTATLKQLGVLKGIGAADMITFSAPQRRISGFKINTNSLSGTRNQVGANFARPQVGSMRNQVGNFGINNNAAVLRAAGGGGVYGNG